VNRLTLHSGHHQPSRLRSLVGSSQLLERHATEKDHGPRGSLAGPQFGGASSGQAAQTGFGNQCGSSGMAADDRAPGERSTPKLEAAVLDRERDRGSTTTSSTASFLNRGQHRPVNGIAKERKMPR